MIEDVIVKSNAKMQKCIEALNSEMSKIRTGRANPSLLEYVAVSYYGTDTPLKQLASINVIDSRTLGVSAYDKGSVPDIEKAILNANLGLNPVTTGELLRIPLPALTEETRKNMIKIVRSEAEKKRIAIRSIRRDANNSCKELVKEKVISEDDEHKAGDRIQKLTNEYIALIDQKLKQKEDDMLEI